MPEQQERTVRVRVAVVVDERGRWAAFGATETCDEDCLATCYSMPVDEGGAREYCIEADIPFPLPAAPTVEAEVKS